MGDYTREFNPPLQHHWLIPRLRLFLTQVYLVFEKNHFDIVKCIKIVMTIEPKCKFLYKIMEQSQNLYS